MYKFLGQHAAAGFGAGAGKAAIDHTVRQVFGLAAKRRQASLGRTAGREINPYSKRYTFDRFKKRYFGNEPVSRQVAKEFWSDFRYAYQGGLQQYIKETTGYAAKGRANRCPRGKSPRRGYRRADGTRVRATCAKNRRR